MRISAPATVAWGFLVVVIAACGVEGTPAEKEGESAASVEVDAFSGRENPGWQLSTARAARLAELISQLPAGTETESVADGPLGFRGFVVTGLRLPDHRHHQRVRVQGARVLIEHSDGALSLPDRNGSVYAELRADAKTHVTQQIFQVIPPT